ncbi:MAG: type II toxin-antitoxin system PemK/MazF family toxin [Chloroflexota bacterium]
MTAARGLPTPQRGEVWWVLANPGATGGEVRKHRPAVVISVDTVNTRLNRVQVVPLTSSPAALSRVFWNEAVVHAASAGGRPSKVMAHQLATVAKERLLRRVGRVTSDELAAIERAMRLQLGLI